MSPPIPNTGLVAILITGAGILSLPAALADDAGGTGGCAAYGGSIADTSSIAVGTGQCSDGQGVHGTGEARGPYFETALRSRWGLGEMALTTSGCISGGLKAPPTRISTRLRRGRGGFQRRSLRGRVLRIKKNALDTMQRKCPGERVK